MDFKNKNTVGPGAIQGVNLVDSSVHGNVNVNVIGQFDQVKDIDKILSDYKDWVENSQMRKKLDQLVMNGDNCHIKRTLSIDEGKFSADDLLNKIPLSETSLVTEHAGSGKPTLAASSIVAWAKSSESRFEMVLFLSSLHKMDKLPLHTQIWGEFAGNIREQDSSKIYEKLLKITGKLLVIIDGIGDRIT